MTKDESGTVADLPFDPETMDIVCRADTDSKGCRTLHFNISQTVIHHSPTGFEIGYDGSGPADYALNILNLFVPPNSDGCEPVKCWSGECSYTAWKHHQEFKREFIARLPREGGVIHGREVREFLAARRPLFTPEQEFTGETENGNQNL